MSRLIDAEKLLERIEEITSTDMMKVLVEDWINSEPTVYDVDIRNAQLELHTIKLLTLGAKAYAIWFEVITSKMRDNDEIAKLFFELPTVQGTSNIMSLERLKDSNIDVNNISSLEDVIKAIS